MEVKGGCVEGGEEGGATDGGRREGEEKRVITQTTIFTHFTPSGSVSQGKKRATWLPHWPSLHHKVHRLTSVRTPLLLSHTLQSAVRLSVFHCGYREGRPDRAGDTKR